MLKESSGIDQPQCGQEWFRELRAQRQSSSLSSSSFSSLSSKANQVRSLGQCSQGSVSKIRSQLMASRGSSQKDVFSDIRAVHIQHSDHYLIDIASSLKIRFQAPFDSACLLFTPSQGFWVLLSCHCHRQDLFRYLTKIRSKIHVFPCFRLILPLTPRRFSGPLARPPFHNGRGIFTVISGQSAESK